MKYLLIALINAIYGIMLLITITKDTPGLYLIIFIAGILTILGLVGLGLWLKDIISSVKETPERSTALKSWFQIAKSIDILLVAGLLFRAFVLQPFVVDGNSMEPNFHNQEYLLVNQMTFRFREPKRSEVIIFRYPKDPSFDYIKRIIALPGETVMIENGKISVNGNDLNEAYISPQEQTITNGSSTTVFKETLDKDEYFVLGDNRGHSSDSREWGMVPRKNIIGRAWFVVYPFKYFGLIKNPKIDLTPISPSPVAELHNSLTFFSITS